MLIEQGAIPWQVFGEQGSSIGDSESSKVAAASDSSAFLTLSAIDPTEFVSHFTRRPTGAWPDESEAKYLDSLIFGGASGDRGALATLRRIAIQQQLTASNRFTRDPTRVVSFTNRPLNEFGDLRKFRSHLARWDFEPYGLAIRREALRSIGCRPVIYGGEVDWEQMSSQDRPFFHLAGTQANWSAEDEWRYIGDLDLRQFSPNDVMAFVASCDDARRLSPICPWRIVVLGN